MEKGKTWIFRHPKLFTFILIIVIVTMGWVISSFNEISNSISPSNTTQGGYKPVQLTGKNCRNFTYENLVCHSDSFGDYICQSIVYNNCDKTAENVKVIGTYFDDDGEFIGTSWTYTTPQTIDGHSSAPFTLYTTENGIIFDTYKIQIS